MQWCRLIPWHRTGGRDTTTPTVIEIGALRPQHTTASRRSRPHGCHEETECRPKSRRPPSQR
ncbi:hypothetical protein EJB05_12560, partial [Eragrostis curvula]